MSEPTPDPQDESERSSSDDHIVEDLPPGERYDFELIESDITPGQLIMAREGIPEKQENARRQIALSLLGILAFIVAFSMISLAAGWAEREDIASLLELLLPPLVPLATAAVAFYFAAGK
jgi:hypothetical protein